MRNNKCSFRFFLLKCFSRLEWEYKHIYQSNMPTSYASREHGVGHPLGMKRWSFSHASRELPKSVSCKRADMGTWRSFSWPHNKSQLQKPFMPRETVRYLHQLEEQMKLKKWRTTYNYNSVCPALSNISILSLLQPGPGTKWNREIWNGNRQSERKRLLRIGRRSERALGER